jgi:serine/threonine protein phosphatase PrpC
MAPQIDLMVSSGQMDQEAGLRHPDRHALTSVLMGRDIPSIDCASRPFRLEAGDIIVAASDGLQSLSDAQIEAVVAGHRRRTASEIARAVMRAIDIVDDPDQDNTSVVIIKCGAPGSDFGG